VENISQGFLTQIRYLLTCSGVQKCHKWALGPTWKSGVGWWLPVGWKCINIIIITWNKTCVVECNILSYDYQTMCNVYDTKLLLSIWVGPTWGKSSEHHCLFELALTLSQSILHLINNFNLTIGVRCVYNFRTTMFFTYLLCWFSNLFYH